MKVKDRKEKALLHKVLIDILTDCPNDIAYLKRLIFAQEIIANAIEEFTNEEYMDVIMELQKGQSNLTFAGAENFSSPGKTFQQKNISKPLDIF